MDQTKRLLDEDYCYLGHSLLVVRDSVLQNIASHFTTSNIETLLPYILGEKNIKNQIRNFVQKLILKLPKMGLGSTISSSNISVKISSRENLLE